MSTAENMRFAALEVDGRLCLQGGVHDTTSFASLESLLGSPKKISFKDLRFSTWNGLRGLVKLLETAKFRQIDEIPYSVFEELRIMDRSEGGLEISSVFYLFQATEKTEWCPEPRLLDGNGLLKILTEDPTPLVDSPVHLTAHSPNALPASSGNGAEVAYDYLVFSVTVLSMLERQLEATEFGLRDVISRMAVRQQGIKAALNLLQPESQATAGSASVNESMDNLHLAMQKFRVLLDALRLAKFRFKLAMEKEDNQPKDNKTFLDAIQKIREVVGCKNEMEDAGVGLGSLIQSLDESSGFKTYLSRVGEANLTAGTADKIKEFLNVMDPMIGDSSEEIKELIGAEISALENDICNSQILMQGFDLARQVLEHREFEVALPWVSSVFGQDSTKWEVDKVDLFEKMKSKLVTEQETAAYTYFIQRHATAAGVVAKTLEAAPGDMMLF